MVCMQGWFISKQWIGDGLLSIIERGYRVYRLWFCSNPHCGSHTAHLVEFARVYLSGYYMRPTVCAACSRGVLMILETECSHSLEYMRVNGEWQLRPQIPCPSCKCPVCGLYGDQCRCFDDS